MPTRSRRPGILSLGIAVMPALAAVAGCVYLEATLPLAAPNPSRATAVSHLGLVALGLGLVAIADGVILSILIRRSRLGHGRPEPSAPEPPSASVSRLLTRDGRTFPADRDVVIGRAPEDSEAVTAGRAVALELAHPSVSRVHAAVHWAGGRALLADLHSTNGTSYLAPGTTTWVRLQPGAEVPLEHGATISAGAAELVYIRERS